MEECHRLPLVFERLFQHVIQRRACHDMGLTLTVCVATEVVIDIACVVVRITKTTTTSMSKLALCAPLAALASIPPRAHWHNSRYLRQLVIRYVEGHDGPIAHLRQDSGLREIDTLKASSRLIGGWWGWGGFT